MKTRIRLALGLAQILLAGRAWASFQNTPFSIKAEGLGGAFVGIADDPTAVFINPAGLVNLRYPEVALMYGKPFAGLEGIDLSEGYTALAFPIGERVAFGA